MTTALWHPPLIYEMVDHEIEPPAARPKFWLDRKYQKGATWLQIRQHYEHELKMNRDRQTKWRHSDPAEFKCSGIVCSEDLLNALVRWGKLDDDQDDDPEAVAKAIGRVLDEMIRNDPQRPRF